MTTPTSSTAPRDAAARRIRRLVYAALTLAIATAIAVALSRLVPPAIRRRVVDETRARGIDLDPGAIEVRFGEVRLRGARFSLVGVRGLSGSASRATVELHGLAPSRVVADGVELSLTGSGALEDLPAWAAQHRAHVTELPLAATGVAVRFRDRDGAPELLSLEDASLEMQAETRRAGSPPGEAPPWAGALVNARAIVMAREVARTGVAWSLGAAGVSLGLGARDVGSAPVQVELHARPSPTAVVRFAAAPLASIAALAGLEIGASAMTIGGTVEARLPHDAAQIGAAGATAAPLEASIALTMKGFVLPHPRELDGLLFGDTTTVKAEARLSEDRQRAALSAMEVAAGAMKLTGAGEIRRDGADAAIEMDLSGSVPCSLLAGSAATVHLGSVLGALAGDLARRALAGTVAVRVRVTARASRLTAARIDPTAVLRCKVRF